MEPGYFQVKVADPGRHSFFFLLCSKEFFALDDVDGPDLKSFPCLSETKKNTTPQTQKRGPENGPFLEPCCLPFHCRCGRKMAALCGLWN